MKDLIFLRMHGHFRNAGCHQKKPRLEARQLAFVSSNVGFKRDAVSTPKSLIQHLTVHAATQRTLQLGDLDGLTTREAGAGPVTKAVWEPCTRRHAAPQHKGAP